MEKRIIAVLCVLTLMVTAFAACGKKKSIININGRDYLAVTDDAGNTVANDDGDIVVYVTDKDGDYVTAENGEKQTNAVEFPDKSVDKLTVETPEYKFTMPKSNWKTTTRGLYIQNNTEEKVLLAVKDLGSADGITLDAVVEKVKNDNVAAMEEVRKLYPDANIVTNDVKITDRQIDAKTVEFIVKDANGDMFYYAHGTYFFAGGKLFKVEFVCNDGKYYDSQFDLLEIINEGLTVKV